MSGNLSIDFSFNFYCNTYTQFRISSNGFITLDTLGASNGCCTGQFLPNTTIPNNLIALAGEDLNPSNNGTIGYFTIGMAPNRKLVVQFDSVSRIGDSIVFMFDGDGRTWRLETDQHPLHPGNSHPNATVELCGGTTNWTPNLVNILPHNDADPIVDVFCGLTRASYDPNDKTGYPLGVGASHDVLPNQVVDYVIRFQNTGNDTVFTVVI